MTGGVIYQAFEYGYSDPQLEKIAIDESGWRAFAEALDRIGVDQWLLRYENVLGATDGTHWSVEIAYEGRVFSSSGDNHYPGYDKQDRAGVGDDSFEQFLRAVKKLIGGRPFE